MRVLNTLYVTDHRARLGVKKGNLVVTTPDSWTRVPIETLEGIVLIGGAQASTPALGECTKRGIRLASLTVGGRLRFVVGGPTSGNVLLRVAQHDAARDPAMVAAVSRWIVAAKLQNCRRMIDRWLWDAREPERSMQARQREAIDERIRDLSGTEDGDRIRGIEGDGARRYFKCLGAHVAASGSALRFGSRSRRPPRDQMNAVLSFVYGLLVAEMVGALDAIGLDPQIGYLHGLRPGRPSLALDMMEEFRPALADRVAVLLATRRELRTEHFQETGSGACYLTDEGRKVVLAGWDRGKASDVSHLLLRRNVPTWTLPTVQATLLARFLRGDLPVYAPYVMAA